MSRRGSLQLMCTVAKVADQAWASFFISLHLACSCPQIVGPRPAQGLHAS